MSKLFGGLNKEQFIAEVLKLDDDPYYRQAVEAVLPNDGETLENICKKGWENYLKHCDGLKGLMD